MSRQTYLAVRFSKDLREDYSQARTRAVRMNLHAQREIEDKRNYRRKPIETSPHEADFHREVARRKAIQHERNHTGLKSPADNKRLYEAEQASYQSSNRLRDLHIGHVKHANATRKPMAPSAAPKMAEEMAWHRKSVIGAKLKAQQAAEDAARGPKPVTHTPAKITVPGLDPNWDAALKPKFNKKVAIGGAVIGGAIGGAATYRRNKVKRQMER